MQGYDPVKISIKNFKDSQWLVACMIPKGNMMASTLNKVDSETYDLIEFRCSNKTDTPKENKELEEEFKLFLSRGISRISRQGDHVYTDINYNFPFISHARRHSLSHRWDRNQGGYPGPDAEETGGGQESCYGSG